MYAAQSAMIVSPETYKERAKKTDSKQAQFLRLLAWKSVSTRAFDKSWQRFTAGFCHRAKTGKVLVNFQKKRVEDLTPPPYSGALLGP